MTTQDDLFDMVRNWQIENACRDDDDPDKATMQLSAACFAYGGGAMENEEAVTFVRGYSAQPPKV